MISPHTPPGTKVVCIEGGPDEDYPHATIPDLVTGEVYTVARIVLIGDGEFLVDICEAGISDEWGYCLEGFRLAELPRCLTELVRKAPSPLVVA